MEFLHELVADLPSLLQAERAALRLVVAALLGAVIGMQRELAGKDAGLRTHMLVALGTAFFVTASQEAGMRPEEMSRIIQGVATGVGFVGAGAILKRSNEAEILGLTTAASLWVTAAVGVAVGLGRLGSALLAVLLGWVILTVFGRVSAFLSSKRNAGPQNVEP